jgi:hypothetical protein
MVSLSISWSIICRPNRILRKRGLRHQVQFAEDLVKLKLGKLAKIPFSIRHRNIALLEGELKSPGREIAFISKAQETFR